MAVMANRKQDVAHTRQGQEVLLDVAQRLFVERGYANVSMQQIAEEAGMTKGAPYYYFQNKEALFAQVCVRILAEMKQAIFDATDGAGSFRDSLIRCLMTVARSVTGNLEQWFADIGRVFSPDEFRRLAEEGLAVDDFTELLVPQFRKAAARGEFARVSPETAARVFRMMLMLTVKERAYSHEMLHLCDDPVRASTEELVDIFLYGII